MKIIKRSIIMIICLIINFSLICSIHNIFATEFLGIGLQGNNNNLTMSLINDSSYSFANKTFMFPEIRGIMTNETPIEIISGDTFTITVTIPCSITAAAYRSTIAFDNTQINYVSSDVQGSNENFTGKVTLDPEENINSVNPLENPKDRLHNQQVILSIGPKDASKKLNYENDFIFTLTFKAISSDLSNGLFYYPTEWVAADATEYKQNQCAKYLIQTKGKERVKTELATPSIELSQDNVNGGLSYSITDTNNSDVDHFEIQLYSDNMGQTSIGSSINSSEKSGNIALSDDVKVGSTYYAKVKTIAKADSLDYKDSLESELSDGVQASKIKLKTPSVELIADENGDLQVKVTDNTSNGENVLGYQVEVFEADAQNKPINSAVFTSTIQKDTPTNIDGLTAGKKYVAKVTAVAAEGNYMDSEISSSNVVAYKGTFPTGLSISVANDLKYTGSPVNVNPQISGGQLTQGSYEFKYKGRNSTNYDESTTSPTLPGDYTVTLALTDAGKEVYLEPATYPSIDFVIAKGVQTVTLSVEGATDGSYTYGSTTTPLKLKISGLEGNPSVSYSIESGTGTAMINNDNTLTITKAGTLNIKAEYEATTNYEAGNATYTLEVNKGTLSLAAEKTTKSVGELITLSDLITLKNEAGETVNSESVTYNVQANNAGIATGSQTTITPTSAGEVVVTVSTAGSDLYNVLSDAKYTITVNDLPKTTITFHKNDGTVETSTQSITEKLTEKLKRNSFVRDGYTFEGWALTQNGEVKYTDEADYEAKEGTQTLDLYAKWAAIPITAFTYENINSAEVGKEYTSVAPSVTPTIIDGGNYTYSFISQSIELAKIDKSTGIITFTADSKGEVEFTVKVEHPNGSSKETTVKINVVLNKLDKPDALKESDVTIKNKSITINTSNSGYEYSLKDANGTVIKTVKGNGSALVFDSLRADTEYILVQRAKGDGTTNSDSDWSDDYKLKTAEAEAPVIGTLKAEAKDSSILLSWTVTDDGGASITSATVTYKYKVKENGVDEVKNGTQTFTNLNDAKSVTLTGLTNGTEYYDIQVIINNGIDSLHSNAVTATPKKTQSGGNGGGGSFGGGSSSSKNEGWKEEKDGIYYYENGKIVTGFKDIESKTYYFDNSGKMVTGFKDIKNETYYFDNKGVMKKAGWFDVAKKTYYAYEDGVIAKGWLPIEKEWYYMHPIDGHMVKDWVKDEESWYFMGPEGNMWRQHWAPGNNGNWYYVDMDGKMIYNTWIPSHSGYWYYIGSDGRMVTNAMVDGCWINSLGIYHSPTYQG